MIATLPWLWLVSRASGLVLLVALSAVMVLGAGTRLGAASRGSGRFVVAEAHRALALFAVALVGLHVATALLDPYVHIGAWATLVPFVSAYRPAAIASGTLAVDLGAAVLATSILRRRLGFRAWRAVHWAAYAAWPLALAHALTAGGDLAVWWVAGTIAGCSAAVVAAVAVRARQAVRGHFADLRPRPPRRIDATRP